MNKLGLIKFCNLFWGNHLDYFYLKHRSMNHQFYFRGFQVKIIQSTTAITSIVIRVANQLRIERESAIFRHCEANHRFAEAIQKIIQPNLARFVVQKIGFKDAVVPSADFLLESEKRGTPPKSEKAAAFWRVGGAGRGVQPFLRKEKGEIDDKGFSESSLDCVNYAKVAGYTL